MPFRLHHPTISNLGPWKCCMECLPRPQYVWHGPYFRNRHLPRICPILFLATETFSLNVHTTLRQSLTIFVHLYGSGCELNLLYHSKGIYNTRNVMLDMQNHFVTQILKICTNFCLRGSLRGRMIVRIVAYCSNRHSACWQWLSAANM